MTVRDLVFMPYFFDRYINLADPEKDLLVQLEESINKVELVRKELIEYQDYQYVIILDKIL